MDVHILNEDRINPIQSTYAAAALLRRLVHHHRKRHPVAFLQLLPRQALRQLRQADQATVAHLLVHLDGGHAWFSVEEEEEGMEMGRIQAKTLTSL